MDCRCPLHWRRHLYSDWSGLCPHYRYQQRLTHHSDVILMGHGSAGCNSLLPPSVILLWMTLMLSVFLLLPVTVYLSCFLYCMSATLRVLLSTVPPVFDSSCLNAFPPSTGMNGKSILSAMGRHTPEHSSVINTTGSGATTSPSSSRTSSLRSGMGQQTPGGCHQLPCTQVKASEVSSNALNPNTGPARSPRLSPGDLAASSYYSPSTISQPPSSSVIISWGLNVTVNHIRIQRFLNCRNLNWGIIDLDSNSYLAIKRSNFLNVFFQHCHGVFKCFFQRGARLRNICCSAGAHHPTIAPSCNRLRWSFWRT